MLEWQLQELKQLRPRVVNLSDCAQKYRGREVVRIRQRNYILCCEVHPERHLNRETAKEHLRTEHRFPRKEVTADLAARYLGIVVTDGRAMPPPVARPHQKRPAARQTAARGPMMVTRARSSTARPTVEFVAEDVAEMDQREETREQQPREGEAGPSHRAEQAESGATGT